MTRLNADSFPKEKPHRILVCLDGSALSEDSVPFAVSLATTFGSELTLLHVMQPRHEDSGSQSSDALGWEIATQQAHNYLARVEERIKSDTGFIVGVRLEQGRPAQRIVDLARELHADITVLGSHGEGAALDLSLGSTAQEVVASARSSVLIVHASHSKSPR